MRTRIAVYGLLLVASGCAVFSAWASLEIDRLEVERGNANADLLTARWKNKKLNNEIARKAFYRFSLASYETQTFHYPRLSEERVAALVKYASDRLGLAWSDPELRAMVKVAWLESRYYSMCQHPLSTSYGLFGFLDSTWKGTGIAKTDDPLWQTVAACVYVDARYGSPIDALDFHRQNGWY